jgi:hypothetical protein
MSDASGQIAHLKASLPNVREDTEANNEDVYAKRPLEPPAAYPGKKSRDGNLPSPGA